MNASGHPLSAWFFVGMSLLLTGGVVALVIGMAAMTRHPDTVPHHTPRVLAPWILTAGSGVVMIAAVW